MNGKPSSGSRSTPSSPLAARSSRARPRRIGAEPNTQANLVDLGYPGVLPVLNGEAVRMAVRFGLATGAKIARRSMFARKNYFYPDLPKGYQISQYERPVVEDGSLDIVLEDGTQQDDRHHARAPRGGCGQVAARGLPRALRHRPESRRHAAARDRLRARHALGQGSRGVHEEDPHARALSRDLRRQHAGRLVPLRCERLRAARKARRSSARAPRSRTSTRSASSSARSTSRSSARSSCSKAAARSSRKRASTIPDRARRARCARRKKRTTTVTSPTPTCCRWRSTRRRSRRCAPRCRNCRTRRPRASAASTGSRTTTLACSREPRTRAVLRDGRGKQFGGQPKLAANWVMGELSGALNRENLDVAQSRVSAGCAGRLARADRRQHHLRQDRQGSVRGDVARRAQCRRDHRGERPQADHGHLGDRAGHRRRHGEKSGDSSPITARARTSCSASSSGRS